MQLLAKENNQERLKKCPYKEVAGTNLVVTFHLCMEIKADKSGEWGIS